MRYEAKKQPHTSRGYTVEPADKSGRKYFFVTVIQVQDNAPGWSVLPQNDETEALAHRLAGVLNDD